MRRCIELCQRCEAICIEAANHCLRRGGKHAEPGYLNLILACAESCRTSARFMLLRSEFHVQVCGVCADVCEACADDCESKGADDVMKRFVEACRQCAEACREMAGLPAPLRPAAPLPGERFVHEPATIEARGRTLRAS